VRQVESSRGEWYVVATARVVALEKAFGEPLEVRGTLTGTDMIGWECVHPLTSVGGRRPVLPAAHVTADSGTGVVHTAPAHGYDDFVVCKEHGIEPVCPVDERGCFTCEGNDIPWAGQEALGAGTESVIGALKDAGMLVAEHEYIHSYACLVREIKTSLPALRTPFLTRL
jgi:isoleucyl-tRNA synthetase